MGSWMSVDTACEVDPYVANRETELIIRQLRCGAKSFEYHPEHRYTRGKQVCVAAAAFLHAGVGDTEHMGRTWLGRCQTPFNAMMTQEYARYINFAGLSVEEALVRYLRPIGFLQQSPDTSEVLGAFAEAYFHDNCKGPAVDRAPFSNAEAAFAFVVHVFRLLIDLTTAHSAPALTGDEWIVSYRGPPGEEYLNRRFLKDAYNRISALQLPVCKHAPCST